MKNKLDLDAMSIDQVWQLHESVVRVLSARLTSEKRQLEKRLAQLHRETGDLAHSDPAKRSAKKKPPKARRKYPKVFPKYQNPDNPAETWSGRGKRPRWLAAALKAGHSTDEFVISKLEATKSGMQWARSSSVVTR